MYRRIKLLLGLLLVEKSYLRTTGYLKSFSSRKIQDSNGNPIPWMTYSFVAFIEERLHDELNFAEFGSGASTRFFASRVCATVSVESSKEWYDRVQVMLADMPNAEVVYRGINEGYTSYLIDHCSGSKYDVIVVDGRKRVECMINAYQSLSDQGVVIIDDSARGRYEEGIAYYVERGFAELPFRGLAPMDLTEHSTTLLYRSGSNCLGV